MMRRIIWIFIVFFINCHADSLNAQSWFHKEQQKIVLNVDLFMTSTCSHCHDAENFFERLGNRDKDLPVRSWHAILAPFFIEMEPNLYVLRRLSSDPSHLEITGHSARTGYLIHKYVIDQDKAALEKLNNMLNQGNYTEAAFAVPAVFFCNSRWVGFDSPNHMGKKLIHAMNTCRDAIKKHGDLPDFVVKSLRQQSQADLYWNSFHVEAPTFWKAIAIGILDAISPCSLFGFGCLLALWILQRPKGRVSGLLLLLAYGLVHFAYQAWPLFYYQLLPYAVLLGAPFGVIMLAFCMARYMGDDKVPLRWVRILQSEPVLLCFSFLFVGLVALYSQNCTENLSMLLPAALSHADVGITAQIALFGVYYLSNIVVLLLFWFVSMRLKTKFSNNLSFAFAAACFLVLTSFLLLLNGYGLNSWSFSVLMFFVALGVGLVGQYIVKKRLR